jgi:hypothetical protein
MTQPTEALPLPHDRAAAIEMLGRVMATYVNEQYDGELDRKGLMMELRFTVMPKGIGDMINWFIGVLEADADALLICLLMAWVKADPEIDFSWEMLSA